VIDDLWLDPMTCWSAFRLRKATSVHLLIILLDWRLAADVDQWKAKTIPQKSSRVDV